MATSIIPTNKEVEVLYSNSTHQNDIGKTLTLAEDITKYSNLQIVLYGTSMVSAQKCILSLNNLYRNLDSSYYPVVFNNTNGTVRLVLNGTTLTFTSSSFSSAFVGRVLGIK